ncbi:MAG: Ku protein [Candidatus Nanoarchaeia archaeon]
MQKAIWKGVISFGLVSIPVKLVSAVRPKLFDFHLFCKKHKDKIIYHRYCIAGNHVVPWSDIIKGFEFDKKLITFEKNLYEVPIKETKTINLFQFVEASEIDSLYFEKSYYLLPEKGGEKAYVILRDALRSTNLAALGKFVLHEKDYLVLIRSYHSILSLSTIYYADEVIAPKFPELKNLPEPTQLELKLAIQLISKLKKPCELEKIKSERKEILKKLIETKIGKVPKFKIETTKDLMKTLEKSITSVTLKRKK